MSRIKLNKPKRTREVIKATKASRVPGFVLNETSPRTSNNSIKRMLRASAGRVNPQGINPRKKYACNRKKVNMVSHNQTSVVSSVTQLRASALI